MEENELIQKVNALGLNDKQRNGAVCSIIGHSRVVIKCWGYIYCARCEARIGDTLLESFDLPSCVVVGHGCETCRANYEAMTWKDKLYVENPFGVTVQTPT